MEQESTDRRVNRTRRRLSEALISLITEQPYHTITVQAILDRADVGRSTFYAHFRDKDDLFQYGFERMLNALNRQMEAKRKDEAGSSVFPVEELFEHVRGNQHLYGALSWGSGVDVLLKHGQETLQRRIEARLGALLEPKPSEAIPREIVSNYLAGALITQLQWWLDNRMPYSPERMAEIYAQLVMPGIRAVFRGSAGLN